MITETIITIDIFTYKLKIVVYDNVKEIRNKYPDMKVEWDGVTYDYSDHKTMVIIPYNNMRTCIHEMEHVKNCILKSLNHNHDYDHDELDAYIMEYLYDKVEKAIEKHKKKKRKN